MLPLILALTFLLSGSDTSFSCFDAKLRLPHSNPDVVYFVVNDVHYLATFEEMESDTDYFSYSFPEDGEALRGHQTFKAIVIDGEYLAIDNPLSVDCGNQTNHIILLPIIGR